MFTVKNFKENISTGKFTLPSKRIKFIGVVKCTKDQITTPISDLVNGSDDVHLYALAHKKDKSKKNKEQSLIRGLESVSHRLNKAAAKADTKFAIIGIEYYKLDDIVADNSVKEDLIKKCGDKDSEKDTLIAMIRVIKD